MKSAYVAVVQQVGRLLASLGMLAVLDRLGRRSRTALWIRSWFAIYDLDAMLAVGVPWWTFDAVDELEEFLRSRPGARVFEWGSGVSTIWLAARAGSVVSVEHDAEWALAMEGHLPGNVRLRTISPERSAAPQVGSFKAGFAGLDFVEYVAAVSEEEGLFDVIVIDGRAREACLARALAHLAQDGLIVYDNVDRRRYRDSIQRHASHLETLWTRGRTPSLPYPTRTALLRRPGVR